MRRIVTVVSAATLAVAAVALAAPAQAHHSWADYHWARTTSPFTVQLGDNVNATWDPYLARTKR